MRTRTPLAAVHVSAYCCICVVILLSMRRHPPVCVLTLLLHTRQGLQAASAHSLSKQHVLASRANTRHICVRIRIRLPMCPRTSTYAAGAGFAGASSASNLLLYYVCVLIRLYMCPHASTYAAAAGCAGGGSISSILLLYMCPHTTIYVSSY